MIAGGLKTEAPLRTIIAVCKAACPRLSAGSRERFLQSCDKMCSTWGRALERPWLPSLSPSSAAVTSALRNEAASG